MEKKIQVLDCTLRDGGYYTNWDFDKEIVLEYCSAMENLPVDYVEIGYRSIALDGYLGEFFYCPIYLMEYLKTLMPSKKIAIILNEKDIRIGHLDQLLDPCKGYVDLIRVAVDPKNFVRALELAKEIKKKGFELAFNVMYMSNWKKDKMFLNQLDQIDDLVDYFYMVDSYGGVFPTDIEGIVEMVKERTSVPIAFHGHNNLELALINTITALKTGCIMVDSTITGMGRGAGNLKTELLMTYLASKGLVDVAISELSSVVGAFERLQKKYNWGTNLPYMFSGAYSLPQKDVMNWLDLNRYPLSSIVTALSNRKNEINDNMKLPVFEARSKVKRVVLLGGGLSVAKNARAIKQLINELEDVIVVHAGTRYTKLFSDLESKMQYYCLVGSEGDKLRRQFPVIDQIPATCIFPPYPRKMGTVLPIEIRDKAYELKGITFINEYHDSPMAIAIQTAIEHSPEEVILVGFDGYTQSKDKVQFQLANENQSIIDKLDSLDFNVSSATKTNYKNIKEKSLFSYFG